MLSNKAILRTIFCMHYFEEAFWHCFSSKKCHLQLPFSAYCHRKGDMVNHSCDPKTRAEKYWKSPHKHRNIDRNLCHYAEDASDNEPPSSFIFLFSFSLLFLFAFFHLRTFYTASHLSSNKRILFKSPITTPLQSPI